MLRKKLLILNRDLLLYKRQEGNKYIAFLNEEKHSRVLLKYAPILVRMEQLILGILNIVKINIWLRQAIIVNKIKKGYEHRQKYVSKKRSPKMRVHRKNKRLVSHIHDIDQNFSYRHLSIRDKSFTLVLYPSIGYLYNLVVGKRFWRMNLNIFLLYYK